MSDDKKTNDTWHCKAMVKTDTFDKLNPPECDLSFGAIAQACRQYDTELGIKSIIPTQLIVGESLSLQAGRVAEKFNLTVIVLKSVPPDYWALVFGDGSVTIDCVGV